MEFVGEIKFCECERRELKESYYECWWLLIHDGNVMVCVICKSLVKIADAEVGCNKIQSWAYKTLEL